MINVFQVIPPHVASQLYYHFIISSIFIVFTLSNLSFEAMKSAVAYRPSKVPSWKRRQVHQQKSWVPKNESSIHQIPSTCCFDIMFQSIFDIHLVFRCVSIRFFCCRRLLMQNRAPYLHLRLLCGSLSKMSIQKKSPKIFQL